MSKHTTGPWRACHEGDCTCGMIWSTAEDCVVAAALSSCNRFEGYTGGEGVKPGSETYKANARLIAAAPDLLAACEAVLDAINKAALAGVVLWIHPPHQLPGVHESASERLQTVIASALGLTDPAKG